ncbi:shikimate dehydrogenase [Nocardioides exalbidus]|uniref:Shikimate dehydrogenase n=1 Tax=Nocardioides exalbidus TaxID=402596 RepID=A0A1H4ZB15_9ACTN|nr:shikimate dehydrogenase [Nocardioides exalbidus]SED27339.1 shikimate dehydrogenase [Nocardioides exalbidus]
MSSARRCGVLGDPIAHSLSPVLHRAGYAALGLDWAYDAHRVPSGGLEEFLGGLDDTWRGLSLTMPLKREVLPLVDRLTDRARLAGAVNTLLLEEAGERVGDNTDLPGAAAAIRERTTMPLSSAAILGGGATAGSVGLALADLGVTSIEVRVREASRAAGTVEVLRTHAAGVDVRVTTLDGEPVRADVVVSTIPAAAQMPDLVDACRGVPVVFEALYDPWPTPLAASVTGEQVLVSGLDLLVHQAALQFSLFTGVQAPLEEMREAGRRALAAPGPA